MPRPFLMYPDKRLRSVAEPVERVDEGIRALWDEMLSAMYLMPGVGLAANQIGIPKSRKSTPVIVALSAKIEATERSLLWIRSSLLG